MSKQSNQRYRKEREKQSNIDLKSSTSDKAGSQTSKDKLNREFGTENKAEK